MPLKMTYFIHNNIYELTQVHRGKVVWNTIVPLGWTIGWDTVAWVRVSPLAGLLQPGLEYTLAWWDNVALARFQGGTLLPGSVCPAWLDCWVGHSSLG